MNKDLNFFLNGIIVLYFFLFKFDLIEESNVFLINVGNIYML